MGSLAGRLDDASSWYLIAEVGVNHENDMETAKKMVSQCAAGGAHAVKFQTYKADKLAISDSPAYWDTSKEPAQNQHELFSRFDNFGQAEYEELADYCNEQGVEFMSTAFDLASLDYIDPLVSVHKIASADITNIPLLRAVASKGKPVLMSTGAASDGEVANAVRELRSNGASEVTLLHCVLNYPTPDENAFIGRISTLAANNPNEGIGYSDHTIPDGECMACIGAYALGARVFEKHFTHDKSLPGNDHYHAMDADDLAQLTTRLAQMAAMVRDHTESDFLYSQAPAIEHARRSIVTNCAVKVGETLSGDNLTTKRPGSGLSPLHWDDVMGRVAKTDMPEDHLITFDDVE